MFSDLSSFTFNPVIWLTVWLAGVALDLVLGDRKWFCSIPSITTILYSASELFSKKLDRKNRSGRALIIRAFIVIILVVTILCALGLALNKALLHYPFSLVIAAIIVARMIAQKELWLIRSNGDTSNATHIRNAVKTLCIRTGVYYITATIVFSLGGFAALLPLVFVLEGTQTDNHKHPTPYQHVFNRISQILTVIGAVVYAATLTVAHLFWPTANWRKAMAALIRPALPLIDWPSKILTFGFGWSLETATFYKDKGWLGPKNATANLNSANLRDALIVTLIAFSLINGFVALFVMASWIS